MFSNLKNLRMLVNGILGGICIGIGGAFFLAIENKVIGSVFFSLGLFTICTRQLGLFTGRVGYLLDNDLHYIFELIAIWVGNLIGTNAVAYSLRMTRLAPAFVEKATIICNAKLNDNYLSLFILGIFCNILMYIAVDGFKKNNHEFGKYLGLVFCVAGFILAGFEHCVADMFYFGMANIWSDKVIHILLIITLGNIAGGLLIPILERLK